MTTTSEHSERTAVYRPYDEAGVLLYVGITGNPESRFAAHAKTKPWWPDVRRIDLTWYDTREEAEAAEVVAIRAQSPKWNVAIPDEDGRYRTGVGRPRWQPSDVQRDLLTAITAAWSAAAQAKEEYRAMLADVADAAVPIARIADHLGLQRKTVYRHLGRSMT